MSTYEKVFGRPIPDGFKEAQMCLGCGLTREERDCDCPAGSGAILVHLDGSRLSAKERLQLYRKAA